MKKYTHILFDLDQTLWDFEANCTETLHELFDNYQLNNIINNKESFITTYKQVNKELWFKYSRKEISKDTIRNYRFNYTFTRLGIPEEQIPEKINADFLAICPTKTNLVPYAKDLLNYLYPKYHLHIVTNGFKESQSIKIFHSRLSDYFKEIVDSEMSGFLKPDKRIFEYTLTKINAGCQDCIMIGDDLEADVLGARNAGIDAIYFNPSRHKDYTSVPSEIKCLSELFKIL